MSDVSHSLPPVLDLQGQQDAERILTALAQPFAPLALGPDRLPAAAADTAFGSMPTTNAAPAVGDPHAHLLRVEAR